MTEFRTYVTVEELSGLKPKPDPPPKQKRNWLRAALWGLLFAVIVLVWSGHGEYFMPAWAVLTVLCWLGGGEK